MPVAGWQFSVTDSLGVVNGGNYTDQNGTLALCGLVAGAYTVSENLVSPVTITGLTVNGLPAPVTPIYSFVWDGSKPNPFIIVFQNNLFPG